MIQVVGLLALVASLVILGVAVFVWVRAREHVPDGNAPVYRVRKYYAALLSAGLLAALFWTLPHAPYDAYADAEPAMRVEAIGKMWSWELKAAGEAPPGSLILPAGKLIEFEVKATDVTHGFGIYDGDGQLLGQTQAMPGYTNRLRMVFERPGRFHVLCMEYCGLIHHMMVTEFTVQ